MRWQCAPNGRDEAEIVVQEDGQPIRATLVGLDV